MSGKIRFISDYHFGHLNMAKRRGFKDEFEMNEYIVDKHNSIVNKKDTTYILGDITMEKDKWYFYLDQMNGYKKVILGNHDKPQHVPELLKYVNNVSGMLRFKSKEFGSMFLTHCPIHQDELNYRVKYNIHGHVHENSLTRIVWDHLNKSDKVILDERYINVSCEVIDYTPKELKELIKITNGGFKEI